MTGEHPNSPASPTTDSANVPAQGSLHTPGPWAVENPMDFELSIVEANKPTHEWKFIASIPTSPEFDFPRSTAEANARLIAAAPDLLALCLEMRQWLLPELTKEPDRSFFWKLHHAIAKAGVEIDEG